MLRALMYKWFGLDVPVSCETCEVLRTQLDESNRERKELLHRLLDKDKPEPSPIEEEEPVAITPSFVPWRVKQQMLEAEDRKRAELMRAKEREIEKIKTDARIEELEHDLGVVKEFERSPSGGVSARGLQ